MRHLVLLRGPPGVGKSTWVKQNIPAGFVLCPDEIRLMYQSPVLNAKGNWSIAQTNEQKVWRTLFELLEHRMSLGEFTVIDATHSKESDFSKYKKLADKYRYRLWCVQFPIDENKVLEQNENRSPDKIVPVDRVINIMARIKTQPVPKYVTTITPDEFKERIKLKPYNLSEYKKVHIIGDLQGCYTVLQDYLGAEGIKEDEFYIFVGDYIDRGIENGQIVKFLHDNCERNNIMLIEGNHEKHLRRWSSEILGEEEKIQSREFIRNTLPQLLAQGLTKKDCRKVVRKLIQLAWFEYNGKYFLVTHGGLSTIPENLEYVATETMILGSGTYDDMPMVNETFLKTTPPVTYQVHGHRNIQGLPTQVNERCFVLDGKVEFGGNLRCIQLEGQNINIVETENKVWNKTLIKKQDIPTEINQPSDLVAFLRGHSEDVEEKQFGDISSFNFRRHVFFDKKWTNATILARGLFINTKINEIVARSYNKFFNDGETDETDMMSLKNNLQFPLSCYVKYNGFLGLLGYDADKDEIVFATKSSLEGDFVPIFKEVFQEEFSQAKLFELKLFMKENKCNLVFEVIHPVKDPHIIEYVKNHLVLLDIVYRTAEYKKYPFEDLKNIASHFGFECKRKVDISLNNWQEFFEFYNLSQNTRINDIEGYVIEDSKGFMFKIKLPYYKMWKKMRGIKEKVKNRHKVDLGGLFNPEENEFYAWCKTQTEETLSKDVIQLRRMFKNA